MVTVRELELARKLGKRDVECLINFMQRNNHVFRFDLDKDGNIIVTERGYDGEYTRYPLVEKVKRYVQDTLRMFAKERRPESLQAAYVDGATKGLEYISKNLRSILQRYKAYESIVKEANRVAVSEAVAISQVEQDALPAGFAWIVFEQGQPFTEAYMHYKAMNATPECNDITLRAMIVPSPFKSVKLNERIGKAMAEVFKRHGINCKVVTSLDSS